MFYISTVQIKSEAVVPVTYRKFGDGRYMRYDFRIEDLAIDLFYGIYFILFCFADTTINDKKGEEKKKKRSSGKENS